MTLNRSPLVIALALATTLTLAACNKSPSETANETANTPTPAATQAPSTQPSEYANQPEAPAQVSVTSVELGSDVGADQKVTTATTSFAPENTIYASVATTGSGNATLAAKWTFQNGQTVKQDTKTIAPTGAANTAFSISKPDGWPTGDYQVEITLDGNAVATKTFTVH